MYFIQNISGENYCVIYSPSCIVKYVFFQMADLTSNLNYYILHWYHESHRMTCPMRENVLSDPASCVYIHSEPCIRPKDLWSGIMAEFPTVGNSALPYSSRWPYFYRSNWIFPFVRVIELAMCHLCQEIFMSRIKKQ